MMSEYKEAFCLMKYQSDDGEVIELIWNSRDGVTPFVISARDGSRQMTHVDWQLDESRPHHVPQLGDRIFIDHTEETAQKEAEQYVERWWNSEQIPMKEHPVFKPLGKDGSIHKFTKDWIGTVTVVEVDAAMLLKLWPKLEKEEK